MLVLVALLKKNRGRNMDMDIEPEMTLVKISEKKWEEAKLFFEKNPLDTSFSTQNEVCFLLRNEGGITAVIKDFFGKYTKDFINIYIFKSEENFVHILSKDQETKIAFDEVMKKFNISVSYTQKDDDFIAKLMFPHNFNTGADPEKIQKEFTRIYKQHLNKKLLKELLFGSEYSFESRQKMFRGIFSVSMPIFVLRDVHELVQLHTTKENVSQVIHELEKILTKMVLIDRNKNAMGSLTQYLIDPKTVLALEVTQSEGVILYQEIIQKLSFFCMDANIKIGTLESQLSLVAIQARAYDTKRHNLVKSLQLAQKMAMVDLDKVVKADLLEDIEEATIDIYATQFAFALKNLAFYHYLNILPEDFYHLSWSKNLKDLSSEGQTLKKTIREYDVLAHQATNDISYAASFDHQLKIMTFYTKTCKKLIQLGDFNSAHAIYSGLNHVAVSRLTHLKSSLSIKIILQEIETVFSYENSMRNYRKAIKLAANEGKTVIPFLGLHLKELTFAEEGNSNLNIDGSLNIEKLELLGEMYSNLDGCLAQLYKAKPMQSCISLSKMTNIILDEDKVYEASLHSFPKESPDISKCKTIEEFERKILIKRSFPLYLTVIQHHEKYVMPKAYSKLLDFLDKIVRKNFGLNEAQVTISLVNKIKMHISRNHMLTPDLNKRLDKLNQLCIDQIQLHEIPTEIMSESELLSIQKLKL